MKTYTVTIVEEVRYKVTVDAEDLEDAEDVALDTLRQAEDANQYFSGVIDRNVSRIEEVLA